MNYFLAYLPFYRAQDLGDPEHAGDDDNGIDAAQQLRHAESEPGRPARHIQAHGGHQKSEKSGNNDFHRVSASQDGQKAESHGGEAEVFSRSESKREPGQSRCKSHKQKDGKGPCNE
jgi:hypothetical protein